MKLYRANTALYVILLIISLIIVSILLFITTESKWFTIVAGIGCGGIASVAVAWLVDESNCRKLNNEYAILRRNILANFENSFDELLQGFANFCYWYDESHAEEYEWWDYWYDTVFDYATEEENDDLLRETSFWITSGLESVISAVDEIRVNRFLLLDKKIISPKLLNNITRLRATCLMLNGALKHWDSYDKFKQKRESLKEGISSAINNIYLLNCYKEKEYSTYKKFD